MQCHFLLQKVVQGILRSTMADIPGYNPKEFENKWQKHWEKAGVYTTKDAGDKEVYVLDMFPYPSGAGLHVGHPKGYIATDIYARMKRMQGYSVLHPMGWDAFGLPAEQYALANKIHPRKAVEDNIARFKEQLAMIGLDYDWSREINTTDPEYYRWTQWIFLQLFKKGLAYESHAPINWCPSCQTGLAHEDLEAGRCERCGSDVEKKPMRQWVLKIREYADRMLDDLALLSKWPEHIKESQRNWIGKSVGARFNFKLTDITGQDDGAHSVAIFTTRPDTLFGATFVAIAPEVAKKWIEVGWKTTQEVHTYIADAIAESTQAGVVGVKEKTGIFSGVHALNPATGEKIPVWIASYVLADVGTGAIMAVPAHDERDFEFAHTYGLTMRAVIDSNNMSLPYSGNGVLIHSGDFTGMESVHALQPMIEAFGGVPETTYRLQDWVFSRQRYWGEPIPLIHCEKDGVVPVPENELPVRLPEVEHYEPTGTGESPLAAIAEWVDTTCPTCGGSAKRETNTMPQWAGSCWYYLRYMDPRNNTALVAKEKEKHFAPVDLYVGGAEHATRHLIYARFWHKFLFDQGIVSTPEPFTELHSVGLILAADGRKMSKRFGNVVNPDDVIGTWGADAFRLFEMFIGPFDKAAPWSETGIVGTHRFLERVWRYAHQTIEVHVETSDAQATTVLAHTIKKVGEDINAFKFNTAVSSLMSCLNGITSHDISIQDLKSFLKILAPFAPHMSEELWTRAGEKDSIHTSSWPVLSKESISDTRKTIAVQVNGKHRGSIETASDTDQATVEALAKSIPQVQKSIEGKEIARVVYVPGRILNIVTN